MTDQVYCNKHDCGPYNNDSTQKTEHETQNKDCKWVTYKAEENIKNYDKTELKKDEDIIANISQKIYEFAKTKIKKLVVSDSDCNQVYALISNNSHIETLDLSNTKAKAWIRYAYYKETGENHSDGAYDSAISLIKSEAIMDNTKRETIYNRIAMLDDAIYYDLANSEWQAVKITKDSVDVLSLDENTPVFVRRQHQKPQLIPDFDNNKALTELIQLLRIQQQDKQIFKVHLITMFLEGVPVPIMPVLGEQGTIKTTLTKTIKQIVDPSGENVSSLPRKIEDLILRFNNRYLMNFDNISGFNQEVSDILCRAITGEGQSKRALYTDSDEVIYTYRRKIVLNGISPTLEYPDLRERTIKYETLPISESDRLTEEEYNKKFRDLLPGVLGQIFNVLSKALSSYPIVKAELKKLPRMADFAIFGESISRVLGYTPNSFIDNYKARISYNSLDIIESYPIISLIEDFMKERDHYEDTVSNFYKEMCKLAEVAEIDIESRAVQFPAAPNKIKQHIQRLKPNLRLIGLEVDIGPYTKRDGKHPKNRHVIYIDKSEQQGTLLSEIDKLSLPSLPRLPEEKQAQNQPETGRDTGRDNEPLITAPLPQQNDPVPKTESGRDGRHGRDTLPTSLETNQQNTEDHS